MPAAAMTTRSPASVHGPFTSLNAGISAHGGCPHYSHVSAHRIATQRGEWTHLADPIPARRPHLSPAPYK